jgi:hypothetical protein
MQTLETFIAELIVKALHKTAPYMSADDDAKVIATVADFVTAASDLVAVYVALRNTQPKK